MDSELPQYTRRSSQHHDQPRTRDTRPSPSTSHLSSPSQTRTEHSYHLANSKGQPWLILKVISGVPASAYLPAFFEGKAITGSVTLHREKEDSIRSISVQVIGQMTSSVTEVLDFVQISETLWDASSPSSSCSPSKLVGRHSWPFSLTLPTHCQLKSSNGQEQSYRLPNSFSERMARVHIQYQVLVTVHRSRFRVDSKLGTVIGYSPLIRPDAPSMARQLAYLENTPLPGPDSDPDGWKCLPPLPIHGSVFSTRSVDALCTVCTESSLCYTRGSVIPCVITIETKDPQALDLLSGPQTPVVRLLRQIATGEASLNPSGSKRLPSLEYEHGVQELATAVWWPDSSRHPHRRTLHGEIHLPAGLKPTCRLGKFELAVSALLLYYARAIFEYAVVVYPPKAVAFQPEGGGNIVLQREPVVIGTAHAPGPRPRVYSPPGYDDASSIGQSSEFRLFH
ncbi:hypothetical protein C8Q74DRAFT_1203955 [Fomes fomentarius]|nr:hypothetical protein C8Q74DRAFT_1203955 [Fomes fomentarius]